MVEPTETVWVKIDECSEKKDATRFQKKKKCAKNQHNVPITMSELLRGVEFSLKRNGPSLC